MWEVPKPTSSEEHLASCNKLVDDVKAERMREIKRIKIEKRYRKPRSMKLARKKTSGPEMESKKRADETSSPEMERKKLKQAKDDWKKELMISQVLARAQPPEDDLSSDDCVEMDDNAATCSKSEKKGVEATAEPPKATVELAAEPPNAAVEKPETETAEEAPGLTVSASQYIKDRLKQTTKGAQTSKAASRAAPQEESRDTAMNQTTKDAQIPKAASRAAPQEESRDTAMNERTMAMESAMVALHQIAVSEELCPTTRMELIRISGVISGAFMGTVRGYEYIRGQLSTKPTVAAQPVQEKSGFPSLDAVTQKKTKKTTLPVPVAQPPPPPPKTSWSIVVKGKNLSSDEVKSKVVENVSAEIKDVRVQAVIKSKNGGVTLVTKSASDMQKIKASAAFASQGLQLEETTPPGRKMRIKDVPTRYTNEALLDELATRNRDADISEEDFRKEIRILYRSTKDSEFGGVGVEVSDRVRLYWKALGGLDILWRTYRVSDHSGVELCFNCGGHGHVAAHCEEKERLCLRCGNPGHISKDCKNDVSCRNCRQAKKDDKHSVTSFKCPFYSRAAERHQQRLNFFRE